MGYMVDTLVLCLILLCNALLIQAENGGRKARDETLAPAIQAFRGLFNQAGLANKPAYKT